MVRQEARETRRGPVLLVSNNPRHRHLVGSCGNNLNPFLSKGSIR
jgi:hypothetical protein